MNVLSVNLDVVRYALSNLAQNHESLAWLADQLRSTTIEPGTSLYGSTPPPMSDLDTVLAHGATVGNQFAQMLHPHVVGQITIDLAEIMGVPAPDNLFLYSSEAQGWLALHLFAPSAASRPQQAPNPTPVVTPAPAPAPVAAPAVHQAPPVVQVDNIAPAVQAAAQAFQAPPVDMAALASPVTVAATQPTGTQQLPTQPQAQAAPAPSLASVIEDAQFTEQPAQDPQQLNGQASPPPASAGLPHNGLASDKGASPFDKDPGGTLPKSAPPRVIRDWATMAPNLFTLPLAEVVGKGKGSAQRTRAAAPFLELIRRTLAAVPPHVSVADLQHHLGWQLHHIASSAAGASAHAHVNYLLNAPADDGDD